MKPKQAPKFLGPDGRRLWRRLINEYTIDDQQGLVLLEVATQALDRQMEAAEAIAEHGLVLFSENGTVKANPACQVERDSRAAMLQALKALRLDTEVVQGKPGRPPGR